MDFSLPLRALDALRGFADVDPDRNGRMVLGYHIIRTAYGFWLPNDPWGSWSATAPVVCHNMEALDERAGARRTPFSGPARRALSAAHVM